MALKDNKKKEPLLALIEDLERTDKSAHESIIREAKKHVNYAKGFQRIWYDDVARDFRFGATREELEEIGAEEADFGRVINIIKSHQESVISAVTSAIPRVRFLPRNAENPNDIIAAQASSKVSDKIDIDNDAQYLLVQATKILWDQTFVCAYIYNEASEKYGKYSVPLMGKKKKYEENHTCPNCNALFMSSPIDKYEAGYKPQPMEMEKCPNCQMPGQTIPSISEQEEIVNLGEQFYPKNKECIELYGRLNVMVPVNAKSLADCPYLILEKEVHYTLLRAKYPDIADQIPRGASGGYSQYNRWARMPVINTGDVAQRDYPTERYVWLRPEAYWAADEELRKELEKEYPDGVRVCLVNDVIADCIPEKMDDHIVLSKDPMSPYIDRDPVVRPLIEIQESTNDIYTLIEETVRQSIPDVFGDPEVLDFKAYGKHRKRPGTIFPLKTLKGGRNADQHFFVTKTASLSQEVELFRKALEMMGQFVVGDFPQIFGGPTDNATLGQDELAKNQALQRLSHLWKMLNSFWAEVKKKAVVDYVNNLKYDENFVRRTGDTFENIWIRRIQLRGGEVGDVVPETSEQFPLTWAQKRAMFFQMLQANKQPFDIAVFGPDNAQFVSDMIQLNGFRVPGENDRNKQLTEISELLKTSPLPGPTGEMLPTIPPDPLVDNNEVCVQVIRAWAVSPAGLDAKANNQEGYANVMAQLQARLMMLAPPLPPLDDNSQPGPTNLPNPPEAEGAIAPPGPPPGGGV